MSKYDPLRDHLARLTGRSAVRMTFAEIEGLVGALPVSARTHRAWWSNDSKVEAQAWREAGWHVERVDQAAAWVEFEPGARGGTRLARAGRTAPPRNEDDIARSTVDHEVWEGDVQRRLVEHLRREGWTVQREADTASKERGIDVLAERGGRTAAFEVKGFPGRSYRDPARASERKPTSPSTQARHWFAGAVLTALLTKSDHPDWTSNICLPAVPTYLKLARRTARNLRCAGVGIWIATDEAISQFVDPDTPDDLRPG